MFARVIPDINSSDAAAEAAVIQAYFRRTRVRSVGTEQITPLMMIYEARNLFNRTFRLFQANKFVTEIVKALTNNSSE